MAVRDTPVTYELDEVRQIQTAIAAGLPAKCPRCGDPLSQGPPIPTGRLAVREVWCAGCRRCAMVSDSR